VEAATLLDKARSATENPLILLPAGLFVIVVGLLLALRARRSEPSGETEPPPESKTKPPEPQAKTRRWRRDRGSRERTPEERRQMHEERMRRRRQRADEDLS
jgi:hypothetical protein